ncbi:MAG: glycosyltransferase family 2 protein [Pirellulaceae bacterium]
MKTRPERSQATLSVVLPLLNEEAVLDKLVSELAVALDQIGCRWNVVLVNDGSTDNSAEVIDRLAQNDSRLKTVHLSRNFGHQAAVHAGLSFADGDAVVFMDSDGQDDPSALAPMFERWLMGDDVIYAVRFGRKEGLVKRFLFKAFYFVLQRIASVEIPRDAGNFGLIDRRVAQVLLELDEQDRYLPGLRSWVGFRQSALQVERFARHDERPRVSILGLCSLAKNALFGFSRMPLQAFYALAILSAAVCVGCVGFALYHRLITGQAIPGWTSMTSITAFFGAMNALGIAILGEYVSRIYDQVRQRPKFIVERTCNLPAYLNSTPPLETLLDEVRELQVEVANSTGMPLATTERAPC